MSTLDSGELISGLLDVGLELVQLGPESGHILQGLRLNNIGHFIHSFKEALVKIKHIY